MNTDATEQWTHDGNSVYDSHGQWICDIGGRGDRAARTAQIVKDHNAYALLVLACMNAEKTLVEYQNMPQTRGVYKTAVVAQLRKVLSDAGVLQ